MNREVVKYRSLNNMSITFCPHGKKYGGTSVMVNSLYCSSICSSFGGICNNKEIVCCFENSDMGEQKP
jgi:hypothetical protein